MTEAKRNLPAHGYLGYYHGANKTAVRDLIKKKFKIPKGSRIIVNDHSQNVYECEVLVPEVRAVLRKAKVKY
jgi:hypothetical protein